MVRTGPVESFYVCMFTFLVPVPLGQRRRFGPAPAEETAPPQLAQPSPSAYPRSANQDTESPGKRGREESPSNGDPKGKPDKLTYYSCGHR